MTGRPRPIRPTEATRLADDLRALADELTRPGAETVQRSIGHALDAGYPPRASTVAAAPTNRVDDDGEYLPPDTQPEAGAIHPDHEATRAAGALHRIRMAAMWARHGTDYLAGWHRDRAVRFCHRCGHPLQGPSSRCENLIDGVRCEAREGAPPRVCRICEQEQGPGQPLRSGRCDRCRKWLARHGLEWPHKRSDRIASVDRIQLQDTVITTEEARP